MKIRNFALAGALIGMAACGSGGKAFVNPVDPGDVRSAVMKEFGVLCEEIDGDDTIGCGKDSERLGNGWSDIIRISVFEEDDGSLTLSYLSLKHSKLDRDSVLKVIKQFGFSQDDFREVTGTGQRLNRDGFQLVRFDSETAIIYAD